MEQKKLKAKVMDMRRWAVVGVTADKEKFGYKIWQILREKGYIAYGVNPKRKDIDGEKVYPTLSDLPIKPDVVDIVVGPKVAGLVLKEAADLGIRNIFFQPGSYDEETLVVAEQLGLAYIVDDCVYATLKE